MPAVGRLTGEEPMLGSSTKDVYKLKHKTQSGRLRTVDAKGQSNPRWYGK